MMGKKGRPLGFRLSEESKRAISESKRGQRHKTETKDKISRSLIVYFRKLNPLSEEILKRYNFLNNEDINNWVARVKEQLDDLDDVHTEKVMRNHRKMELTSGHNVEFYSHRMTPEKLVMLKEHCEANNLTVDEALNNPGM